MTVFKLASLFRRYSEIGERSARQCLYVSVVFIAQILYNLIKEILNIEKK